MNIAKTLLDIADDLKRFVEECRRGETPDFEVIRTARHRLEAQAEMLEQGLHE